MLWSIFCITGMFEDIFFLVNRENLGMDGLHMRRLFVLDSKDYDDTHSVTVKNTVRAIICRDGRYAMQQNRDGIYKIPGGGVENNESLLDTLCRETLEETGLVVVGLL